METEKAMPIPYTEITSSVIGKLKQSDFDDWWESEEISIPYLNNEPMAITFMDLNPEEDKEFVAEADKLLKIFLAKTNIDRLSSSKHVHKNCTDFLAMIEYDEDDEALHQIKSPEEVWQYVQFQNIYLQRYYEDNKVYLSLSGNCDWEQEHGLQLVFDDKGKLMRVSQSDGDIFGWEGDGMIEEN